MRKYAWFPLFLLILCVALAGCRREEAGLSGKGSNGILYNGVEGTYAPIESPDRLTDVWRSAETFTFEDDSFELNSAVVPYYDPDAGTLTVLGSYWENDFSIDESTRVLSVSTEYHACLFTLRDGGAIVSRRDLTSLFEGRDEVIYHGAVTAEAVIWLSYNPSDSSSYRTMFLNRFSLDGEAYERADLAELYGGPADFFTNAFAVREDGMIAVGSSSRLLLLDGTFSVLARFDLPASPERMGFLPDGSPAFTVQKYPGGALFSADIDSGTVRSLADTRESAFSVFFGRGADWYDADRTGIYASEDGTDTLILNRQNSDYPEDMMPVRALDRETFLCMAYTNSMPAFFLLRRAEDIELADVKTLEVAVTNGYDYRIEKKIRAYNQSHPGVRVILNNLAEDGDWMSGTDRLSFNLANGLYQPDIVLTYAQHSAAKTILAQNLWGDLTPYLESDPEVNPDNLFAAVKDAFSDGQGGMWGIAPFFKFFGTWTLRNNLPDNTEESWTLAEYMDFAGRFSQTTGNPPVLMTQDGLNISFVCLGRGWLNKWIDYDAMKCDFSAEDFAAALRFWKSLPKTEEDLERLLPDARDRWGVGNPLYREGKTPICYGTLNGFEDAFLRELLFGTWGTDDLVPVGYPAEDGYGRFEAYPETACILMKSCEEPELAWDLIRTFFGDTDSIQQLYDGFPALKSSFEAYRLALSEQIVYYDASSAGIRFQKITDLEDLRSFQRQETARKGMILEDTDRFLSRLEELFDEEGAFLPIIDYTPSEITDIVNEEISAYLGRGTSEEDCAAKIQSRVSIWLAEHR